MYKCFCACVCVYFEDNSYPANLIFVHQSEFYFKAIYFKPKEECIFFRFRSVRSRYFDVAAVVKQPVRHGRGLDRGAGRARWGMRGFRAGFCLFGDIVQPCALKRDITLTRASSWILKIYIPISFESVVTFPPVSCSHCAIAELALIPVASLNEFHPAGV